MSNALVYELESTRKFFLTTLSIFEEADSAFAPHPDMYTVAGQVVHTANSVDWFMAGGFGAGWDQNYDEHIATAKSVTSLAEARLMLDGAPHAAVINGITDHTAHHRGSLAVYARLLGKVPPMPYA
jgi:hypothetical protein